MKKRLLVFIGLLSCFLLFVNINLVNAKEVVKTERVNKPNGEYVGLINLYDDNTIEFLYDYRVNNIKIKVCETAECDEIDYQIQPNRSYLDGQEALFYLDEYLPGRTDQNITYKIIASANFILENSSTHVTLTLEHEIEIKQEKKDDTEKEYNESLEKVKMVINKWIIPIIYLTLGITIVIKGILLAIDVVRYADLPDLRKKKIMGFVYLAIALLLVALINTGVGFITGLFNRI